MKVKFSVLAAFLFLLPAVHAQTTAFTYQGRLNNGGSAVTGAFDFRFRLFDVNSNLVAGPLTNAPVGVTNGLFTTTVDFGPGVFDGTTRTLEIGVRTNGSTGAYTVLSPQQPLTSVPYAIQSLNASNAAVLTAPLAATNLAGTLPNSLLSTNVAVLTNNVIFTGNVTATNFTGNGFGLSNLPATSLIGTIPDARLSTNVALQSNPALNFAGNVAATNFTGAGHGLTNVPGAFFWVVVATTNTLAYPNVGYICTNDSVPVTITLQPSYSVGDTFRVAGVGGAGWILMQTNNQNVLAGNLSGSIGQNWKAVGSSLNWSAIASSADGSKLVATVNNGQIWTSTNSGATWTAHGSTAYWSSVASSADGTKLAATVGYTIYNSSAAGALYTSSDSGVTWTSHTSSPLSSSLSWSAVASSADGSKLVAAVRSGSLYLSSNSGSSWTAVSGSSGYLWTSLASSGDGAKLVAVTDGGQIFTSTNSGSTWLLRTTLSGVSLSAVASSSDGVRLVATTTAGAVYVSSDSGASWILESNAQVTGHLTGAASSADGSRLATAAGGSGNTGNIFTSSSFGASWMQPLAAPTVSWSGIASSADGSVLAATVYGGNIYVSSQNSTTTGTTGYLIGPQHSALELEYVGNGVFLPLSHEGSITAH